MTDHPIVGIDAGPGSSAEQAPALLECSNLSVDLGTGASKRRVIEGLDLRVTAGEFVCILGESGVGKTTLLRILGGLALPAPGSNLSFDGRPMAEPPRGAVVVFQNYSASLLPWRTVQKNVELGLEPSMSKSDRQRVAREALDRVGLGPHAGRYPRQLSGGMQQRVQIARALALSPRLLLMDEPFGALDAMTRERLQDQLREIHATLGTTIVFVTHDVDEAVYLSHRLIVLAGSPADIALDVQNDLPHDRDQETTRSLPRFLALRSQVHRMISGHGED